MQFDHTFRKAIDSLSPHSPATGSLDLHFRYSSHFPGSAENMYVAGQMLMGFASFLHDEARKLLEQVPAIRAAADGEPPPIGAPAVPQISGQPASVVKGPWAP